MAVTEAEAAQCAAVFARIQLLRNTLEKVVGNPVGSEVGSEATYALWERPLRPVTGTTAVWNPNPSAPQAAEVETVPSELVPYVLLRGDLPVVLQDVLGTSLGALPLCEAPFWAVFDGSKKCPLRSQEIQTVSRPTRLDRDEVAKYMRREDRRGSLQTVFKRAEHLSLWYYGGTRSWWSE